jgi:opacity protein-like surface antigen
MKNAPLAREASASKTNHHVGLALSCKLKLCKCFYRHGLAGRPWQPVLSVAMRRLSCVLFLLASVVCSAQTASAQSPWYIEGSAGAFLRSDASRYTTFFNSMGPIGPGTNTTTYYPGSVFNLGVGYKLPFGFRIEVEGGYAHYKAESVSPLSLGNLRGPPLGGLDGSRLGLQSGGGHDQYSATLNAFYDLPMSGAIVPYVGVGVGVNTTNAEGGLFSGLETVIFRIPLVEPVQFTQSGGNATNAVVLAEAGATSRSTLSGP